MNSIGVTERLVIRMNWLSGYWELEEKIITLEGKLKQLELDSIGDSSIQVLANFLIDKKEEKKELIKLVSTFKHLDNKILKLKYIDKMTLESIANQLGFSDSYIYKKHAVLMKVMKSKNEVK